MCPIGFYCSEPCELNFFLFSSIFGAQFSQENQIKKKNLFLKNFYNFKAITPRQCPPGSVSLFGQSSCNYCSLGQYAVNNNCETCPAGSYCPDSAT